VEQKRGIFTSDKDYIINLALELPHPGSEANHEGGRAAVQHQHQQAACTLHSGQSMKRYGQQINGDLDVVQKPGVI
jgi:hypothetical protein